MNKEMKQYLEAVVTSVVNEDSTAAKAALHEYLRLKTQEVLGEAKDDKDEEDDKDDEGSGDEEEGSGSGSGEDESSEEDKKPNPFAKKSI